MERPSGEPRAPQQTVRHGPLSFRPWVRVTGTTLRFMASREQSFSSGCSGRWGSEGRAGRRPWDEEAEAGSTAMAAGPGARLWRLVFVLWGQGPPVGKAPPLESWQMEKSDVEKVGMFPAVLTYYF